jgi:hypothetical protein
MNAVFATVMLAMLVASLDQTIVSTALPTIVADVGEQGHMSWVITSYLLAETIGTVLAGRFGDLCGRKILASALDLGRSTGALRGLPAGRRLRRRRSGSPYRVCVCRRRARTDRRLGLVRKPNEGEAVAMMGCPLRGWPGDPETGTGLV